MDVREVTGWFILAIVIIVVLYDTYVYVNCGPEATISRVIYRAHEKWPLLAPLVAFALGALWGHFFWPLEK